MISDSYLEDYFSALLVELDRLEAEKHKPSGKLSAGRLGDPLQWQILSSLAVDRTSFDPYTLRKFQRGKDCEERVIKMTPDVLSVQEAVNYRGVVGYMDMFVDTKNWYGTYGQLPLEIKSVSSAKMKRIEAQGGPDRGHILQNCLYALAKNTEYFAIRYICSDDYREKVYVIPTIEYASKVDAIITRYDAQKISGLVPVFVPEEAWQKNKMYNGFHDWAGLTEEQIADKVRGLGLPYPIPVGTRVAPLVT